jgi:hypothetical protein
MRKLLIALGIGFFLLGCEPKINSRDWVVDSYVKALLRSQTDTMQKLAASGIVIEPTPPNPNAQALHVIKLCKRGEYSDQKSRYLALIGGGLNEVVNGVELVLVQEGEFWKVLDARLSVDEYGGPVAYLRNCQVDQRFMKR